VAKASFNGLRVLSLESRRATEIAALITTFGGRPTVAPALRELPRSSNAEALAFVAALIKKEFDAVVFLTGVGARALLTVIDTEPSRAAFIAALARTKVIARGPKPVAVLREWRVPIWVAAPEPNTWRELLAAVDARFEELPPNPRVAVQEYGTSNQELLDGLRVRGARVTRVPVYQWALPEDLEPLKLAAVALANREIDVALFTTSVQIVHLFSIATSMHIEAQLRAGLARTVIASIGPTTSNEVRRRGLSVDLEASHPRMGVLVTEAAAKAAELLVQKSK
jgi:uroporphyrinogen-III synthase